MMSKKNILLLPLIFLFGCAQQPLIWDKPGATQQQFQQDKFACMQGAQQYEPPVSTPQPQGQMVGGRYVAPSWTENLVAAMNNSAGGYSMNQSLFTSCMQAKGYTARQGQANQSTQNNQPSGGALELARLKGKQEEICANFDLKAYYEKSSCSAKDITFQQITDTTKISENQKLALSKQRFAMGQFNNQLIDAQRKYLGEKGGKFATIYETIVVPQNEKIALDLYNGKITWGEYNQHRKDIYVNSINELNKSQK
jgi:hypothetical protein